MSRSTSAERRLKPTLTAAFRVFPLSTLLLLALTPVAHAQQRVDEEYTRKIKEYLRDPRISTELVDHLPASNTVPSPLKFHGRIVGTWGELTYAKDIHAYLEAVAKAAPARAKFWSIGKSEEGRDMIVLAIADEATMRNLERNKANLKALTDPRRTSEAQARQLIGTTKPVYWVTSGMHSGETGGPEMLMELAYRLVVSEMPFIQEIRRNVVTFITPVIEVDGREKMVDTYYFNKKRPDGEQNLPLMYWGKYVAHDNNRDGMGHMLNLTKNVTKTFVEWVPTVLHDLHEQAIYLYSSTGTGPYNEWIDAITVDEWWLLAKNDVMEMTKRGIPGVWTYGFYDGWTPNYMFFIAHTKNSIGRFYEVARYGPDTTTIRANQSREWYRPNPALPEIAWGPRNNTNIQQSALLFSLSNVAKNRQTYVENYWLKNKRAWEKGKNQAPYAWHIPARQYRKSDAAQAVNDLRFQGLEFHRAEADFRAGNVEVKAGDYIVRADQPYRTLADMYFSVQRFSPANPNPYDDTGWTFQYMRNLVITPVAEKSIQDQRMTPITADVRAPGGVEGTGPVIVVDHTTDNNLVTFRFKLANVPMQAAEQDFEAAGRRFRAGAFIIPNADRARIEPMLRDLGLSGYAMAAAPNVAVHDLDVPRIGYVHSWANTQNEGWIRGAFDVYGVPYTYFADIKLREGNLRSRYDVIVYPHVGGNAQSQVNGIPKSGSLPLPYQKTAETPNLGAQDQADDIRGGMGIDGLMELYKFVQEGGTLIVEGATSTIFPEYHLTNGITVESPDDLFARGSVMRGVITDTRSPIVYGYQGNQVPVYFNQSPVLNAGGGGGFAGGRGGRGGIPGVGQNTSPMATRPQVSTYDPANPTAPAGGRGGRGAAGAGGASGEAEAPGGRGGRGGGRGGAGGAGGEQTPRVVVRFPANPNDMLLSGTLVGGEALSNRAQVIDAPLGEGHVVMFGIRPFWRWQTQGTFFMGFNAILNWNDLNAGRGGAGDRSASGGQ
ncbi:MAG TPA: M14 family zinc carboxypeptidase [Gemmatimonadaceae bacterium]|nr:M14 family zinc carboxypeptidase [Gemmatimonadaceae bacterium]